MSAKVTDSPPPAQGRRLPGLSLQCWQASAMLLVVSLLLTVGLLYLGSQDPPPAAAITLRTQPLSAATRAAVKKACPSGGPGKRYLVTGAAGFIGFHSALALAARGDVVIGLDNFNDYYPVSLKRARAAALAALAPHNPAPVVDRDLNDEPALRELFALCPFTHVLHLAAQAGVRYAARNPHAYVQSNLAASVVLLEVMRAQRPAPPVLVYASSSSVYGLSQRLPFAEDDRVDRPASLYAATKRSLELLVHSYHNIYRLSVTGLRFFTVYGPWGRPDMSVLAFAKNIVDGKPIRVFLGPNGTELARDFTYIDDVVSGVLAALDTSPPSGDPKVPPVYRLFNLGNTQMHTVSDLVNALQELLGQPAIVHKQPLGATGDVLRTNADISAARQALGYAPQTALREGLAAFVHWFRTYYGPDGRQRRPDEARYVPD